MTDACPLCYVCCTTGDILEQQHNAFGHVEEGDDNGVIHVITLL
jgi:hypothetical protein